MFYLLANSLKARSDLIAHLKKHGILSTFHYLSLHKSPFYAPQHDGRKLPHADRYTNTLLRLPMFYELDLAQIHTICECIRAFYA